MGYDYKSLCALIETMTKEKEVHDKLHSLGVPYTETEYCVGYFDNITSIVSSGYKMGEVVSIKCNGELIAWYDNTFEYARTCKWKAQHGRIEFDFTKKSLRELCKTLKLLFDKRRCGVAEELAEQARQMLEKAIDWPNCDISSKTKDIFIH